MVCDTSASKDISIQQIWIPISNNIRDMFWTRLFYKLGQRSRSKQPKNGTCHFAIQIWNSYLKEYRRYASDSMQFLETRSEVKFKVTVNQLWYATLRHPKMHPHTKFGIPTLNNIRDMLRTPFF